MNPSQQLTTPVTLGWGLLFGFVSIVVADIADYALIGPYPIKMSKQYENS
jgi:hypothetical protein